MSNDYPYGASAAERAAYLKNYKRPEPLAPTRPLTPLEAAKIGERSARQLADRLRNGHRTPAEEREFQRWQAEADKLGKQAQAIEAAEAKRKRLEADPAYQNAKQHAESFARTADQDRANTAFAILDSGDVQGYWAEVRAIEEAEYAKLDAKRSDAELHKLAADRDHAKAELASIEAKHRLESIP